MTYDNWKTTNPADDELGSREQRPRHRHEAAPGECVECDKYRGQMHPSHDASPNCESGKRAHCTCSACF